MDRLPSFYSSSPSYESGSMQNSEEKKPKHSDEDLKSYEHPFEDDNSQAAAESNEGRSSKKWYSKFSFKSLMKPSEPSFPKTPRASLTDDKSHLEDKSRKWNHPPHQKGNTPLFSYSKGGDSEKSTETALTKSTQRLFEADPKVLEDHLDDVDLLSLCIKCNASGPLGIVHRTAVPFLQTKAFHCLNLSEILSCCSLKLAEVPLNLSDPNMQVLELKTLSAMRSACPSSSSSQEHNMERPLHVLSHERDSKLIGGSSINNYPGNIRGAQINCDFFHNELHPDYLLSLVADGCNWGRHVQEAAQRAVFAASKFITQVLNHSQQPVKTAENLAWVLVQSIATAHEAIVSGYRNTNGIGTTTLNICIVFVTPEGEKFLMVAGVGDCKVLIATETDDNHYEVCQFDCAKRLNLKATDPGGRIGPYDGEPDYIDPDLRNLSVNCIPLPKGKSIIFNMTDGVHDNLNPEMLGKSPSEVDERLPISTNWSDLQMKSYHTLITSYQNALFENLINKFMEQKPDASLDQICEYITDYCHKVTSYGRDFMVAHPSQKEPEDKKVNPGKMDHCTIVAFEVNN